MIESRLSFRSRENIMVLPSDSDIIDEIDLGWRQLYSIIKLVNHYHSSDLCT